MFYLLACIFTTLVYPYYTVFEFPHYYSSTFWLILVAELICLIDILFNFFKQQLDEQGQPKNEALETIALNYFRTNFFLDLLLVFPVGYVMSLFDRRTKFLWIIKAFRVKHINSYLNDSYIKPIVSQ